jgi:hypothetical protein
MVFLKKKKKKKKKNVNGAIIKQHGHKLNLKKAHGLSKQ